MLGHAIRLLDTATPNLSGAELGASPWHLGGAKILLSHPTLPVDLGGSHQFCRQPKCCDSNWQKLGAIPQTMKRGFAQAIELALLFRR